MPDPNQPPAQPKEGGEQPAAPKQDDNTPKHGKYMNIAKNALVSARNEMAQSMQGQPGVEQILACLDDALGCIGQAEQQMANPMQQQPPAAQPAAAAPAPAAPPPQAPPAG